jgi:hypothetical protein
MSVGFPEVSSGWKSVYFIFGLFNDTFDYSDYVPSDDMISEQYIGKDVQGSGRGLIFRVLSSHLPGSTE